MQRGRLLPKGFVGVYGFVWFEVWDSRGSGGFLEAEVRPLWEFRTCASALTFLNH